MKMFLYVRSFPQRALSVARQVMEEDEGFRGRVAAAATEENVGAAALEWLNRSGAIAADSEDDSGDADVAAEATDIDTDAGEPVTKEAIRSELEELKSLVGQLSEERQAVDSEVEGLSGRLETSEIDSGLSNLVPDAEPLAALRTETIPGPGSSSLTSQVRGLHSDLKQARLERDHAQEAKELAILEHAELAEELEDLRVLAGEAQVQLRDLESRIDTVSSEKELLAGEKERLAAEKELLATQKSQIEAEHSALSSDHDALAAQVEASKLKLEAAEADLVRLNANVEAARSDAGASVADLQAAVSARAAMESHVDALGGAHAKARAEIERVNAALADKNATDRQKIDTLRVALASVTAERDALQAKLETVRATVSSLQGEMAKLDTNVNDAESVASVLGERMAELQSSVDAVPGNEIATSDLAEFDAPEAPIAVAPAVVADSFATAPTEETLIEPDIEAVVVDDASVEDAPVVDDVVADVAVDVAVEDSAAEEVVVADAPIDEPAAEITSEDATSEEAETVDSETVDAPVETAAEEVAVEEAPAHETVTEAFEPIVSDVAVEEAVDSPAEIVEDAIDSDVDSMVHVETPDVVDPAEPFAVGSYETGETAGVSPLVLSDTTGDDFTAGLLDPEVPDTPELPNAAPIEDATPSIEASDVPDALKGAVESGGPSAADLAVAASFEAVSEETPGIRFGEAQVDTASEVTEEEDIDEVHALVAETVASFEPTESDNLPGSAVPAEDVQPAEPTERGGLSSLFSSFSRNSGDDAGSETAVAESQSDDGGGSTGLLASAGIAAAGVAAGAVGAVTSRTDEDAAAVVDDSATAGGSVAVEEAVVTRTPVEVPSEVIGDSLAVARHVVSTEDIVLLVDGDPVAAMGWPSVDRVEQRRNLVHYLNVMAGNTGAAPDVLLDRDLGVDRLPDSRSVRVRTTNEGGSVAAQIIGLIDTYPREWPVAVITDNSDLAAEAAMKGANVLDNGQLLDLFIAP